MNARFWVWRDGWVKLTLRPGQSLHTHECKHTDEGFHEDLEQWTHTGYSVVRQWEIGGRDCDGLSYDRGTDSCELDELASIPAGNKYVGVYNGNEARADDYFRFNLIYRANWTKITRSAYDQYAEAAGY